MTNVISRPFVAISPADVDYLAKMLAETASREWDTANRTKHAHVRRYCQDRAFKATETAERLIKASYQQVAS
jgi:hypothetical protein